MVAYNLDHDIIEYDYYIYKSGAGHQFDELLKVLSGQEKEQLYTNLGIVVGKMHSHRFFQPVSLTQFRDKVVVVPRLWNFTEHNDWIREHIEQIYMYAERYYQLQPYVEKIVNLLNKYGNFRKYPPRTIGMVHFDLSADNLIVTKRGQSPDDFVFIDPTYAGIGSICLDLARIERRFTVWRGTLPLNEVDHYLEIFYKAYQTQFHIPDEYSKGEGMIYRLAQIIDDFWMFETNAWMKTHQEYVMEYTIWELDRIIKEYS